MITYDNSVELFMLSRAAKSDNTIGWYRARFHTYAEWLKRKGHLECWSDSIVLMLFFADLAEQVKKESIQPETPDAYYRALKALCNWLVKFKKLAESPMTLIERPSVPDKAPRQTTKAEYDVLLGSIRGDSWVDQRDRLIIALLFRGGLRVGELVALQVTDIDLSRSAITVMESKTEYHLVPLLNEVKRYFAGYITVRPESNYRRLILSADGHGHVRGELTDNGIRQMLERRCQKAHMPYRNPHSMRHGVAVHLINDLGADMAFVQALLGHDDISTTINHYGRWKITGLVQKYEALVK